MEVLVRLEKIFFIKLFCEVLKLDMNKIRSDNRYRWMRKRIRDCIVGGSDVKDVSVEDKIKVKRVLRLVEWYLERL